MTTKMQEFAQAVGQDVKRLDNDKLNVADFNTKLREADPQVLEAVITSFLQSATLPQVEALRTEILGDDVPENLDTLKELADAISNMGESEAGAIVQKVTELGQKVDLLDQTDFVAIYNQAKA